LTVPHLLVREVVVGLVLIGVVMVFSLIANAPLADAANPGMSPNPAKAPWYFVGIQELLLHFHPLLAVLVVPLAAVVALLLLPYLRYERDTSGVFMMSHKGRTMAAIAAVTALVATPVWILLDEYWIDLAAWLPKLTLVVSTGLIPAAVLLAAIWGFFTALKMRFSTSNDEAIQACFVLVLVAFAVLTVTGVWFRGPGMALVWP
jgi:quinol-cytochrome oxidoreductase complex cytochrome b subunit